MKINAISATTFGNKPQILKSTIAATSLLTGAVVTDTFVKGISKPNEEVENFVKAHDDMDSGCCFDFSVCDD